MAAPMPLRVRAYCPRCRASSDREGDSLHGAWACGCGETKELAGPWAAGAGPGGTDRPVERCAFCGCAALYIEKDFHQGVGCAIMAAAPVIPVFLPMAYGKGLLVSILALAAVDYILYYGVIRFRTVCYRCCAEHRGGTINPEHKAYDLSTAELFAHRDEAAGINDKLKMKN